MLLACATMKRRRGECGPRAEAAEAATLASRAEVETETEPA